MSDCHLVVQFSERANKERSVSYSITCVELDRNSGLVVGEPLSIWQTVTPESEGEVPPLPFVCDIDFGVRQYRDKDGGNQHAVFVRHLSGCEHVVLKSSRVL